MFCKSAIRYFFKLDSKEIKYPNGVCSLNLSQKQVGILKEVYFSMDVEPSNEGFLEYLSSYNSVKKPETICCSKFDF